MNKAFIFDMDGVLIDSEHEWQRVEQPMLARIVGEDIALCIGNTVGMNAAQVFEKAQECGGGVAWEDVMQGYSSLEPDIYQKATITDGAEDLIDTLASDGYRIGLVTQSAQSSLETVLARIRNGQKIERAISLWQHQTLRPKPAPDGYVEILKGFEADPQESFILEDSNSGIESAKGSGAYVIGFQENLVSGYQQTGADIYAKTMHDVATIVDDFSRSSELLNTVAWSQDHSSTFLALRVSSSALDR